MWNKLKPATKRAALTRGTSVNLREQAQGRDCQVRLPNVCNFNPQTTVLAHIRRGHTAGIGQKPPDVCATLACSACHDVIDKRARIRRTSDHGDGSIIDGFILEGMCRTLAIWVEEGFLP